MPAAERAALRQTEWTPRLARLRRAALGLRQDVLPKSRLGLACQYLLNQWDPLVAHLEHGCTRIDNNRAENTIRPAKDTLACLRDVLIRLPTISELDNLDPLLPANWTPPMTPPKPA